MQVLAEEQLSLSRLLVIIEETLEALTRIHAHGIVHRDIKPENILIFVGDDGEYSAKLMDFGIARQPGNRDLTQLTAIGGHGLGTPEYMAPEQIDTHLFGEVSPRTDLYAVGLLLFDALAGTPPFTGTFTQSAAGHVMRDPDLGLLPERLLQELAGVLRRALAKRPEQRFESAEAFRTALRAVPHDTSVQTRIAMARADPSGGHPAEAVSGNTLVYGQGTRSRPTMTSARSSRGSFRSGARSPGKWVATGILASMLIGSGAAGLLMRHGTEANVLLLRTDLITTIEVTTTTTPTIEPP